MKIENHSARICCVLHLLLILGFSALPAQAQTSTVWVTMPDGVRLLTDLYQPPGSGPWPVVLIRTTYNRLYYYDFQYFVDNGYFVVVQSCRGRNGSEGFFWMFQDDRSDGHATIDWIAQQPWCNGNVGMIGLSALAQTQYEVMHDAPPALKCLAPERTAADRYPHGYFQGGAYRHDLMEFVCGLFSLPQWCDLALLHRLHDEWWDDIDLLVEPDRVHVPMLHIGGWYDFSQQSTLDTFSFFQHHGGTGAAGNQYMIVDPMDHLYHFGELADPPEQFPRGDGLYYHQHLLDWLDHWLKQPGPIDTWLAVHVYLMGACEEPGAPGCHWVDLDNWPPSDHWPASFYLAANGTLSMAVSQTGDLELTIDPEFNYVPTLGGANSPASSIESGPYDQAAIESRADVLVFTTDVLTEPVEIMGRITARIWINPDTFDLDLSVRLTDVYPDGRSMLITDGIQRARMRCGDTIECFLTPGMPEEIEVDLWSAAIVFNAGHRIRVAIAGTNYPRFERNDNSGGDLNNPQYQQAHPLILFGPDHPTSIELPIPALFADGFESGDTSVWAGAFP